MNSSFRYKLNLCEKLIWMLRKCFFINNSKYSLNTIPGNTNNLRRLNLSNLRNNKLLVYRGQSPVSALRLSLTPPPPPPPSCQSRPLFLGSAVHAPGNLSSKVLCLLRLAAVITCKGESSAIIAYSGVIIR